MVEFLGKNRASRRRKHSSRRQGYNGYGDSSLSLGIGCYLIKEDGLILIDAGMPNQGKEFLKQLKGLSIEPRDSSLMLLTDGHWDHIASVSEFKRLTGCKVAINQPEKDWVEQAFQVVYYLEAGQHYQGTNHRKGEQDLP